MRLRFHQPSTDRDRRVGGDGDVTAAKQPDLPGAKRKSRKTRLGRHQVSFRDRRLQQSIDHRDSDLRRPSRGPRTRCGTSRPGHAVSSRTNSPGVIGIATDWARADAKSVLHHGQQGLNYRLSCSSRVDYHSIHTSIHMPVSEILLCACKTLFAEQYLKECFG